VFVSVGVGGGGVFVSVGVGGGDVFVGVGSSGMNTISIWEISLHSSPPILVALIESVPNPVTR
jgi:hypothetical protein